MLQKMLIHGIKATDAYYITGDVIVMLIYLFKMAILISIQLELQMY